MEDLVKIIGKASKNKRLQKNISQEKLANLCGISLASITRFETGRGNISLLNLISILTVLGIADSLKSVFLNYENELLFKKNERVKWSKKNIINTQNNKVLDL